MSVRRLKVPASTPITRYGLSCRSRRAARPTCSRACFRSASPTQLGQQVLIDNKGGAGGNLGTDLVAKSKPDGYTLLFGTAATHGINISLYESLSYDPVKDFEAIALCGIVPMVLLVPPRPAAHA